MTSAAKPQRLLRAAKIAAVVAVVMLVAVAHKLGVLDRFAEPARLRDELVALGPWGYAAFLAAYTVFQPFGVPGTIFVFAAPLIWPWPIAFALSMVGTMSASVVGFSFARFVARDTVAAMLPARFRRYDDALARRAFATVVLLRFLFWMPPLLHAFFGVSKVRFWTHFWGSFVGYLVPLFLVSYFGQQLFDVLIALPKGVWVSLAAFAIVVAGAALAFRQRRARALRERAQAAAEEQRRAEPLQSSP